MKIRTVDGLDALLDEEHWEAHIVSGHPEMQGNLSLVIDTLENAAAVFRSRRDPETRIYLKEHSGVTLGNRLMEQVVLRVYVRQWFRGNGVLCLRVVERPWGKNMAFVIEQEFAETEHSYDREGDVLYLSFGPPVPAVSLVVEDWLVLRVSPSFPPKFVGMTLVGFKKLFSRVRPDLIEELPARVEHLKTARLVIEYSDERDTCTFRFEADEPAYYERFGESIYLERAVLDGHITGLKITDYTARGQAAIEEVLTAVLDSLFSVPRPNSPVDALTRAFLEHFDLRHLLTLAA